MFRTKYEQHQNQTNAPTCIVAFSDFEGNFNSLLRTISEATYGNKPLFQIVYEYGDAHIPSFFTLNPELNERLNLQVILGGDNINRGDKNLELVRFINNTIKYYKEARIPFARLHIIAGNRDVTALRLAREYPYRQEMLYTGVTWGPKKTIQDSELKKVFAYTLKDFLIQKIDKLPAANPLKIYYQNMETAGREAVDAFLINEVLIETGEYAHPEWFIQWQLSYTMGAPRAYELYKNELEKIMAISENSLTELATVKLLQILSLKLGSAEMQALLHDITHSTLLSAEQMEKFIPYAGIFYSYLNEASLISILDLPDGEQKAFISHSGPSAAEILPLLESGCSLNSIQTQWNTKFHDALQGTYVIIDGVPCGEAYDNVQRVPHIPGCYFVSYTPNIHLNVDDIATRTERKRSADGQFSVMNDYDLHEAYICSPDNKNIMERMEKLRAYGISLAFCGHLPTGPSQGLLIDHVSAVFTDWGRALNTGFAPEGNNTDTTGDAWSLVSYHSDGRGNSFFLNQGVLPKQHVPHILDGKKYCFCVPHNTSTLNLSAFPTEFKEYIVAPSVGLIYKDSNHVIQRVIGLFDPADGTGLAYYTRSYSFESVKFELASIPLVNQYKWYPTVDHFNSSMQTINTSVSAAPNKVTFLLDIDGTISLVDELANPPIAPWLNIVLIQWLREMKQQLERQGVTVEFDFFTARDCVGCLEHAYFDYLAVKQEHGIHTIKNIITQLIKEDIQINHVYHAFDGLDDYHPGQFYNEHIFSLEETLVCPTDTKYIAAMSWEKFEQTAAILKTKDCNFLDRARRHNMLDGKYPLKSNVLEKIMQRADSDEVFIVVDDNELIINELRNKFNGTERSPMIVHCPKHTSVDSNVNEFYARLKQHFNAPVKRIRLIDRIIENALPASTGLSARIVSQGFLDQRYTDIAPTTSISQQDTLC